MHVCTYVTYLYCTVTDFVDFFPTNLQAPLPIIINGTSVPPSPDLYQHIVEGDHSVRNMGILPSHCVHIYCVVFAKLKAE